jgi:hypothetical protein
LPVDGLGNISAALALTSKCPTFWAKAAVVESTAAGSTNAKQINCAKPVHRYLDIRYPLGEFQGKHLISLDAGFSPLQIFPLQASEQPQSGVNAR